MEERRGGRPEEDWYPISSQDSLTRQEYIRKATGQDACEEIPGSDRPLRPKPNLRNMAE